VLHTDPESSASAWAQRTQLPAKDNAAASARNVSVPHRCSAWPRSAPLTAPVQPPCPFPASALATLWCL